MTSADTNPIIETDRLILRLPTLDDFERWAEMLGDPEAARYIGGVVAKPVVWRIIMQVRGAWELTGVSMFSVVEKARDLWIGRVGPWQPHDWPGPEVGWGLHRDAWGKGYALEAAAATMDFAFGSLGWPTVVHCINPANTPSQALARRLGSTILRQARMPPPVDHEIIDVWGQTRDQWIENRSIAASVLNRSRPRQLNQE
jgi:RimJ/RimL family protein N-acetyltransferase